MTHDPTASALTARIEELEKENAELHALVQRYAESVGELRELLRWEHQNSYYVATKWWHEDRRHYKRIRELLADTSNTE